MCSKHYDMSVFKIPGRAFVILANAGIHSLQLVSLDSRIRGNDGQWHLSTVAYTSGSECNVSASAYFRVSFSVFFRVIPWLMLLLISVSFRGNASIFSAHIPIKKTSLEGWARLA